MFDALARYRLARGYSVDGNSHDFGATTRQLPLTHAAGHSLALSPTMAARINAGQESFSDSVQSGARTLCRLLTLPALGRSARRVRGYLESPGFRRRWFSQVGFQSVISLGPGRPRLLN
jgi:hypothetical protein